MLLRNAFRLVRVAVAPLAGLLMGASLAAPARAQTVDTTAWVPNGFVNTVVPNGNKIYIGGYFTYIGPKYTGYGATLNPTTGALQGTFPKVDGPVEAVVADGSGGWFIGGSFATVGTTARSNLAHILSNGTVDAAWNPNADFDVNRLALSGSTLYAAGNFSQIGGQGRSGLAALVVSTGLATSWDPGPDDIVDAIAVRAGVVYVGGNFSNIGGQPRSYMAAIDSVTGAATPWDATPDGTVWCLAVRGSTIYAGGTFTSIGGQPRNYLAALDATTALANSWNPNPDGSIASMALSATALFVTGGFYTIGGGNNFPTAALDLYSGLARSWNPVPYVGISCVTVSGSRVYLGGQFTRINNYKSIGSIAMVDTANDQLTTWAGSANSSVSAIAATGSAVYAGGNFTSIGGSQRRYAAAIDASTGHTTPWDPNVLNDGGQVKTIALSGAAVYVGGQFQDIGGQHRNYIAQLDSVTGTATAWDAHSDHYVSALLASGSKIYAGGLFDSIGGQKRNQIAALDTSTALATSWNPNASGGSVGALAANGTKIYAGGAFTTIGGAARNCIAALDATTGLATSWNPNPTSPSPTVFTLSATASTVYAGGDFTIIGGSTRNHIAALDAATGLATAWDPNATNATFARVISLQLSGSIVYVAGGFNHIGGATRNNIAAIDASTGLANSWNPNADDFTFTVAAAGTKVYVGGQFLNIAGHGVPDLAALTAPATVGVVAPSLGSQLSLGASPNPARGRVELQFSLPARSEVRASILDVQGRRVAVLAEGAMSAGEHSILWDGRTEGGVRAGAGVYWALLSAGNQQVSRRLVRVE